MLVLFWFSGKVVAVKENQAFSVISETFRNKWKSRKFSETEFVGVLRGASFGTNLKAVLVMDYTLTLLTNTYMAIGAFP